jgi:SAM-dependent methyltransferase
MSNHQSKSNNDKRTWDEYVDRYRSGEWRAPIFHDMILEDARVIGDDVTFLDIGCGGGFDGIPDLQVSLAESCAVYIGVEPDSEIEHGKHINEIHRCTFEESEIAPGSIHVAFSVMVLEHIENPHIFFDKLHSVLTTGGIFWGLTVDSRHYFSRMSKLTEALGVKDRYLDSVHGERGVDRYENYPTYYRANSPSRIKKYTRNFSRRDFVSFSRVGQLDYYTPKSIKPLTHMLDRLAISAGWPGPTLAVRLVK